MPDPTAVPALRRAAAAALRGVRFGRAWRPRWRWRRGVAAERGPQRVVVDQIDRGGWGQEGRVGSKHARRRAVGAAQPARRISLHQLGSRPVRCRGVADLEPNGRVVPAERQPYVGPDRAQVGVAHGAAVARQRALQSGANEATASFECDVRLAARRRRANISTRARVVHAASSHRASYHQPSAIGAAVGPRGL